MTKRTDFTDHKSREICRVVTFWIKIPRTVFILMTNISHCVDENRTLTKCLKTLFFLRISICNWTEQRMRWKTAFHILHVTICHLCSNTNQLVIIMITISIFTYHYRVLFPFQIVSFHGKSLAKMRWINSVSHKTNGFFVTEKLSLRKIEMFTEVCNNITNLFHMFQSYKLWYFLFA